MSDGWARVFKGGFSAIEVVHWLCRRGVLGLIVFAAIVAPVAADDTQFTVNRVRATSFPSITVRFTISSARGAALPLLKPEDFVVTEAGKRIGSVASYSLLESATPLALVIALDGSSTMNEGGKLAGAKQAAKTFISQLRPIDQVEIISFGDKVGVVVPFTHDQAALARGIDNLSAKGNPVFFDATDRAISDVLRVPGTRLVVLITDGQDMASHAQLAPALDLARQSQVPIFTIGLGDKVSDEMLTRMASETAGRYFKAPRADDLAAVFRLLALDIVNQYELTYISPLAQEPGKNVSVVVRVARAGLPGVEGQFSYTMPPVVQEVVVPVNPGVLQPVADPAAPLPAEAPPPAPPASAIPPEWAAVLASMAVLALLVGITLRFTNDTRQSRLAAFVTGAVRPIRLLEDNQAGGLLVSSFLGFLARVAKRLLPASQIEQIRHNLVLGGSPNGLGVERFLAVRMLVAMALGFLGYLLGRPNGVTGILVGVAIAGAIGFLLPVFWLGGKIRTRQRLILRAMPNALDLIAVTVEAGLGFDQAVHEVCMKWQNELTREFAIFLNEMQMGASRRDALHGIIERTGVPELNGFVSAVIQADEMGTGIARTLNVQAEQARMKRRQRAEKLAHEATIKMIFPLVFLIFPAIFVVILGPAVPVILESLGGLGK